VDFLAEFEEPEEIDKNNKYHKLYPL